MHSSADITSHARFGECLAYPNVIMTCCKSIGHPMYINVYIYIHIHICIYTYVFIYTYIYMVRTTWPMPGVKGQRLRGQTLDHVCLRYIAEPANNIHVFKSSVQRFVGCPTLQHCEHRNRGLQCKSLPDPQWSPPSAHLAATVHLRLWCKAIQSVLQYLVTKSSQVWVAHSIIARKMSFCCSGP